MRIHKAGIGVILVTLLLCAAIVTVLVLLSTPLMVLYSIGIVLCLLSLFVLRFFRNPKRKITITEKQVIAPADGKVVAIEEIVEDQFLNDKRIQVSIFMSVWNVHINWLPVLGKVVQALHYNGRYMAAWLPKSSAENERSVVVIETVNSGKIMVKQIAGAVARRIITYPKADTEIKAGDQLGFIRFGSRVDVLLPVDSKINVSLNDRVIGGKTLLAELSD
ncbi:MAG: phosphatidylserine decarboxylase family protein [Salinivirgaceae bacterium]|jgi:phosphatidylserine decarboxylase|nr:phosphatidylserine decarboxylase family protein [Salinivirgaceae bacterium]